MAVTTTMFFIDAGKHGAHLADVAARVFQVLGVREWEERQSANYPPDEHYFAGYTQNAFIQVYQSDDDRMQNYPYRVSVEKPWRVGQGRIETDPQKLARALAAGGFNTFIPRGAWPRANWDGDGEVFAEG